MKKAIIYSLLFAIANIIIYNASAAPQPAPTAYPAVLDAVDADFMNTLYVELNTRQTAYYNSNGRYFQGLITHGTTPQVGFVASADMLAVSPDDQEANWLDFWPTINMDKDYALEVHSHYNNNGFGYTMIIKAFDGTDYYTRYRTIGTGGKEQPWTKGR